MKIVDYGNDGHKDLFFANSHVMNHVHKIQPHLEYLHPLLLLRQVDGKFVNVSAESGAVFREKWASRGAAFGDLDNDGDIDAVVVTCGGPAYVLRNEGGSRNNWIGLDLHGTRSNRDGIGAQVKLTAESGRVQYGMHPSRRTTKNGSMTMLILKKHCSAKPGGALLGPQSRQSGTAAGTARGSDT